MSGMRHPPIYIEVPYYEQGILTVRGIQSGNVITEASVQTRLAPEKIDLVIDTAGRTFSADGSDILLAYAQVTDRNGTTIKDSIFEIEFSVEGAAEIIGDQTNINANPMRTINGVAPVLLRADTLDGSIKLTAKTNGLKADTCNVVSQVHDPNKDLAQSEAFVDIIHHKVDLGAADQLLQYDWYAWNGTDSSRAEFKVSEFKISLETLNSDGIIRWLGEMNVMGKYGYAYGEGVLMIDSEGSIMRIHNLPAGTYELRTYHHAPVSNTDSMDPK